jgi:hypothetical protein
MKRRPMKTLIRVAVGLCLAALLAAASQENSTSRRPTVERMESAWVIIPGYSVGPIQIGMSDKEVRAVVGEPERTSLGGWEYMSQGFAILFDRGHQTVDAILGGDTSTPDGALSKLFVAKTRDGIGMASERAAVLGALGEPRNRRLEGEWEFLEFPGLEVILIRDRVCWLAVRRVASKPQHRDLAPTSHTGGAFHWK